MVGKKIIMALTGFSLVAFLFVHLFGNLAIYYGPEGLNTRAQTLKGLGVFIWLLRSVMLVFLSAHVFYGIQLTLSNRKAKSEKYAVSKRLRSTFAARNMVWTGLLTGCFLFFHLLHFTFRVTHPGISANVLRDSMGRPDMFTTVVHGFLDPAVVFVYILGLFSLAFHLAHGIQSMFQSVGLTTEKTEVLITRAGSIAAIVLSLGFLSIPVAVLAGFVR